MTKKILLVAIFLLLATNSFAEEQFRVCIFNECRFETAELFRSYSQMYPSYIREFYIDGEICSKEEYLNSKSENKIKEIRRPPVLVYFSFKSNFEIKSFNWWIDIKDPRNSVDPKFDGHISGFKYQGMDWYYIEISNPYIYINLRDSIDLYFIYKLDDNQMELKFKVGSAKLALGSSNCWENRVVVNLNGSEIFEKLKKPLNFPNLNTNPEKINLALIIRYLQILTKMQQ